MLIVQYFVRIQKKSVIEEVEATSTFKRHDFQRTNQHSRKSIVLKTIDRSSVAPVRPKWRSRLLISRHFRDLSHHSQYKGSRLSIIHDQAVGRIQFLVCSRKRTSFRSRSWKARILSVPFQHHAFHVL